jgi:hypothetical protein
MSVDVFASVMGLDTPHIYKSGDLTDLSILKEIANVSQKPVSAIDNGKFIEAVLPDAK